MCLHTRDAFVHILNQWDGSPPPPPEFTRRQRQNLPASPAELPAGS